MIVLYIILLNLFPCTAESSCLFIPIVEQHLQPRTIAADVPLDMLMLQLPGFVPNSTTPVTDGVLSLLFQENATPGATWIQETIQRYVTANEASEQYARARQSLLDSGGTALDPLGMGGAFGEESTGIWRNVVYQGFLCYEIVFIVRIGTFIVTVDSIGESGWMNERVAVDITARAMRPFHEESAR